MESHDELLQSNLGSGSVSLYQSICEKLGRSLEPVTLQTPQVAQPEQGNLPKEEMRIPIYQAMFGSSTALMVDTRCGRPGAMKKKAVHSRQKSGN